MGEFMEQVMGSGPPLVDLDIVVGGMIPGLGPDLAAGADPIAVDTSIGRAFDRLKFDAPVLCDEVMETFAAKRRSFAPSERTPTEIAENMKAGLRGCQTKQDIITWRSQANIVKDEAFLTKEHPGIWADVLALGKKLSAELPGTVS